MNHFNKFIVYICFYSSVYLNMKTYYTDTVDFLK